MEVINNKNNNFKLGDVFTLDGRYYLICYTKELEYFTVILNTDKEEYLSKVSKKFYSTVTALVNSYKNNSNIKKLDVKLLIEK